MYFEIMTYLSSGEVDDDINFNYDTNTEVSRSCAASLNGKMFVLGGWNQRQQVNIKQWLKIVKHSYMYSPSPKIDTPKIDTYFKFRAHTKCANLWRKTVL